MRRTITFDLDDILARAERRLPDQVELVTVEPDDQLSDASIRLIMTGNARVAENDAWSDYFEAREARIDAIIKEVIPDPLQRAVILHHDEVGGELRKFIEDRDPLDVFQTLIDQTRPRLWRYPLGLDLDGRESGFSSELAFARELAQVAGIPLGANREALMGMVNGMTSRDREHGQFYVLWYGPAPDLLRAVIDSGPAAWLEVAWTNPHLLLLDSFEGTGHVVKASGVITRHLEPALCQVDDIDHDGPGYSWSDIAEFTRADYAAPIRLRTVPHLAGPVRGGLTI